ncbi:MAG: TRAP transporter small permease [Colwellia sp.]|nr:TRAP transporter small permease [Colwellia sp.]
MNKFVAKLDYLIEKLLILLMLSIVLMVSWQVLSRYLLHSPSSVSEEVARFLLIWISLIGAVYCYRTKAHLGLDIITNKLAAQQQKIAATFSHVMVFLFSVLVLVIGGIRLVILAFEPIQRSPALDVPMGYIYCVLPLSGLLLCLYATIACLSEYSATPSAEVSPLTANAEAK